MEKSIRRRRRGMTLVEVMVALVLFTFVVMGAFTALTFGRNTLNSTRVFNQVTQILTHEMECMRLRPFITTLTAPVDPKLPHLSIRDLADDIAASPQIYGGFTPFANYSGGDVNSASEKQPQLKSVAYVMMNPSGYVCTRKVSLNATKDVATIALTVKWTDPRGKTYTRTFTSTASQNGINDLLFVPPTLAN